VVQISSSAQVSANITSSKKRQNKCKLCGGLGHSQKTCARGKDSSEISSSSSLVPSSKKVKKQDKNISSSKSSKKSNKKVSDDSRDSDIDSCGSVEGSEPNESDCDCNSSVEEDDTKVVIDLTEEDWEHLIVQDEPKFANSEGVLVGKPDADLPLFLRRETGSLVQRVGVHKRPESERDYFELFFDREIIQQFIDQTNSYAANNKSRNWTRDTDMVEFKSFLAIILYMGLNRRPSIPMYWSDSLLSSPWVQQMMSYTRFRELLRCWHWDDTSLLDKETIKAKKKVDPFFTVKPFLKRLSDNFTHYYVLPQKCCIDESCFPFKGRHKCRCYNPNKPHKWHFKAFCLNCSETGYLYSFFMYQGKDEDRSEYDDCAATEYPVRKLFDAVKYPELQNKNHILCTDNWYTSVVLAVFLLSIGVYLIGTCKSNKKYIPRAGIYKKTGPTKKERGEMSSMRCQLPGSLADFWVYFTSWMDNKPVHIVSTLPTSRSTVDRVHKDSKKAYAGKKELPIPTIVRLYNWFMGYTDLFDQKISYYVCYIKSKRWQHRVYTHFLSAAVVNAHILYTLDFKLQRGYKSFELVDFIKSLIVQLAVIPSEKLTPSRKRSTEERQEFRITGKHICGVYSGERNQKRQLTCRFCGVYPIRSFCQQCNVGLCIPSDLDTVACFEKYHDHKYVGESSKKIRN
jgi:hypothetical protein